MSRTVIALLSAVQPTLLQGQLPRAFQRIGGEPLLLHQLSLLRAIGISKVLIAAEVVSVALEVAMDRAREAGLQVDLVQSPRQVTQCINDTQDLLVLADGLSVDQQLLSGLVELGTQFIAVTDDGAAAVPFERIDINHLWAGIARIPGHLVHQIADLPEDWNVESALLRQAVQSSLPRQRIAQRCLDDGSLSIVCDEAARADAEELLIAGGSRQSQRLSERYILAPVAKLTLPHLFSSEKLAGALPYVASALCLLALLCGLSGWTVAMCAVALLSLVAEYIADHFGRVRPFSQTRWRNAYLVPGLIYASLFAHSAFSDQADIDAILALLVGGGLLLTAEWDWQTDTYPVLYPDPPLALLVLLGGAIGGLYYWSLWLVALVLLALALFRAWLRVSKGASNSSAG